MVSSLQVGKLAPNFLTIGVYKNQFPKYYSVGSKYFNIQDFVPIFEYCLMAQNES